MERVEFLKLYVLNFEELRMVLSGLAKSITRKVRLGVAPNREHLVNCSALKRLCSSTAKMCRIYEYDFGGRLTAEECSAFREYCVDVILEDVRYNIIADMMKPEVIATVVKSAFENGFYTAEDLKKRNTYVTDVAASIGLPVSDELDGLIAECQKELAAELGL